MQTNSLEFGPSYLSRAVKLAITLAVTFALMMSSSAYADCGAYWDAELMGETQGDSVALFDFAGRSAYRITTARLRQLVSLKNRLAQAAEIKADLWLCDDPESGAYAMNMGRDIVILSAGMLDVLNENAEMAASILGHELGHIKLRHTDPTQRKLNSTKATLSGIQLFEALQQEKQSKGGGGLAPIRLDDETLRILIFIMRQQYSQDRELQADEEGIRLMTLAGINPQGAVRALLVHLYKDGNSGGRLTDSHPSNTERINRLNGYLRRDASAQEVAAHAELQSAVDLENSETADKMAERGHWRKLRAHLRDWQKRSPESAAPWYYRGVYERGANKDLVKARQAFFKALQIDPGYMEARLGLCKALFQESRKIESVYCSQALDSDRHSSFVERTFGESLFVGGEIEPFTTVLVVREKDGRKYISNDREILKRRGLAPINYFAE
ncbi:MAG: M48 family metalloprotease [Proteobacteria bacterium]|nr:M48 family metalloprotease [Pseudomonadota bacterium]